MKDTEKHCEQVNTRRGCL